MRKTGEEKDCGLFSLAIDLSSRDHERRYDSTVQDDPRILLIRPSALGDVLRTVPVVASLKAAFPRATIDWVVQQGFEDAVRAHPAVDRVVPFARASLGRWWRSPKQAKALSRFGRMLRGRYDLAIDMQGLGRSGLMLFATGAPRRIGFRNARELAFLGANERYEVDRELHAVTRMLTLLERAGIEPIEDMRLVVPNNSDAAWQRVRKAMDLPSGYVAFAPTSRWQSKAWPADHWRALATAVLGKGVEHVVLLGAPHERAELAAIASVLPAKIAVLAGEATVGVSMAAVRDARALVANDSAMLHAAAGFDTPLVGLFGPTDPLVSGPFGRLADTLRAPEAHVRNVHYRDRGLGDGLMRLIEVNDVCDRVIGAVS